MDDLIKTVGLVAAVILPLWNIPLIARIIRRKSSDDVSLYWVCGVWVCFVFMFPAAISSADIVWKTFNIANMVLFSAVMATVLFYRVKKGRISKNDK
ncbi:MAG: hypothetical protein ABII88_03360 [Candidatus Omnitrophota bacterium]